MRSKYSVSHDARVANASPTINILGVTLELISATRVAFYNAKLSDAEFAAFWTRQSNEPVPTEIAGLPIGDFKAVRFTHTGEPYVNLSIDAGKAIDLIESGAAAAGLKPQPAIAG